MAAFAEVASAPTAGERAALEALSAALDLQLVFGMPERSDGVVYNSAVHVRSLEGAVAADRKIHLWRTTRRSSPPARARPCTPRQPADSPRSSATTSSFPRRPASPRSRVPT